MPKRIFIGGLSVQTTSATLNTHFAPFGTIAGLTINVDAAGGPTGTADVEYIDAQAGTNAIAAKNGAQIDGSTINVREAR
jgi:RNA recognition motif-containing protein